MDDSEVDAEEKGTAVLDKAPASLEGIVEEIPGVAAIKPEMGILIGDIEVAPLILMDIEMLEMTQSISLAALPIVAEEEV